MHFVCINSGQQVYFDSGYVCLLPAGIVVTGDITGFALEKYTKCTFHFLFRYTNLMRYLVGFDLFAVKDDKLSD